MRILATVIVACLGLGACSAQPESVQELQESFANPPPPIELVIATTPSMLSAALTGDPEAMRVAAAFESEACGAASTCPGYGSCGTWSSWNICDEVCSAEVCGFAKYVYQTQHSYRVCFNAAQQACTERRLNMFRYCDC